MPHNAASRDRMRKIFFIGWNRPPFILRTFDGTIIQESGEALERVGT